MAIALVANTGKGSPDNNGVTTDAINTTGADFLVAIVSSTNDVTPTDSKSNSWTGLTVQTGRFSGKLRIWYSIPSSVGSSHTVTVAGTSEAATVCWAAFSGVDQSTPFDVQNGVGSTSEPLQPGSITPTSDNELVITGVGVFTTGTFSINGGFTIANDVPGVGGSCWGNALAYLIQTSAAAANPTWDGSVNGEGVAAVIAAFKAATGGGGGGQPTAKRWGGVDFGASRFNQGQGMKGW